MKKLTFQEYDSLIQAIKYNNGKIFLSCVNENIVNSLCDKGFVNINKDIAIATKNVITLFEIEGEKGFEKLLK